MRIKKYYFLDKIERLNKLSANFKRLVFICIIYIRNKKKKIEKWGAEFKSKFFQNNS